MESLDLELIDPVNIIFNATGGRFRRTEGYLACDNCRGYYELQRGESPEDFCEKCECGGDLTFTPLIEKYILPDNHIMDYSVGDSKPKEIEDITPATEEYPERFELSDYSQEFKTPRELPWGPLGVLIFFLVSIILFGIFGLLMGFSHFVVITNL